MGEVNQLSGELSSLAQQMKLVKEQGQGMASAFGEFSGTGNQAWTMMSRFLSGSGLWAMQNQIRAVGNAIAFWTGAQEKKIEADLKDAEGMKQLRKIVEDTIKQQDMLDTMQEQSEGGVKGLEEKIEAYKKLKETIEENRKKEMESIQEVSDLENRIAKMEDDKTGTDDQQKKSAKHLKGLKGELKTKEKAVKKYFNDIAKLEKDAESTNIEGMKNLQVEYDTHYSLIKKAYEKSTSLVFDEEEVKKLAMERTRAGYDLMNTKADKVEQKRIKKIAKRLEKQEKHKKVLDQRDKIRAAANAKWELKGINKTLETEMEARKYASEKLQDLQDKIDATDRPQYKKRLENRKGGLERSLENAKKAVGDAEGEKKVADDTIDEGKTAKGELKKLIGFKAILKDSVGKIIDSISKVWGSMNKTRKDWWKNIKKEKGFKNRLTKAFSPITKVMKFAAKNLMWFTLLLVGAFLVFSIIRKIFDNAEVMKTIMDTVKGVIEGLMIVLSGVFDIFGAFFGGGTFGERLQLLLKGILKLWSGVGKILMTVVGAGIKLLGGLLLGTVEFLGQLLVGILHGTANFLLGLLRKGVDGWIKMAKFWFVDILWGGIIWPIISPIVDAAKGLWDIAEGIWDDIADFLDDIGIFADGGTSRGGMSIVGERGPELVSLSAGSTVYSNTESKKMLGGGGGGTVNNISVNVSGRVGSTDSELRDIAKKIGKMVSAEINRTTSSSTNVRF